MNSATSNVFQKRLTSEYPGNQSTSIQGDKKANTQIYLPNEMIHMICSLLDNESDTADLKNLRLVSRMFTAPAASYLFRNIQLSNKTYSMTNIQDLKNDTSGPSRKILLPHSLNVLKSNEHCKHVREVAYSALIEYFSNEVEEIRPSPLELYTLNQEIISNIQSVMKISYSSTRTNYSGAEFEDERHSPDPHGDHPPRIRQLMPGNDPSWNFIKAAISGLKNLESLYTTGYLSWKWIAPKEFTDSEKQSVRHLRDLKIDIDPDSSTSVSRLLRYTSSLRSLRIKDFFQRATNSGISLLFARSKLPCLTSLKLADIQIDERDFKSFLLSVAPTLRSLTLDTMMIQGDKIQDEMHHGVRCPWTHIFHFLGASVQLDDIYLEGIFSSRKAGHDSWFIYKGTYASDPFSLYCRVEQYIINGSPFPLPALDTDRSSIKASEFTDGSFTVFEIPDGVDTFEM